MFMKFGRKVVSQLKLSTSHSFLPVMEQQLFKFLRIWTCALQIANKQKA